MLRRKLARDLITKSMVDPILDVEVLAETKANSSIPTIPASADLIGKHDVSDFNVISIVQNNRPFINGNESLLQRDAGSTQGHPFSVESKSEEEQGFPRRSGGGLPQIRESRDDSVNGSLDLKLHDSADAGETNGAFETLESEAPTSLQIVPADTVSKHEAGKDTKEARPLSAARTTLGIKNPISNISSSVLSKPRISPERSILLTPEKRALRADLKSKGQLKRQRLKKVHFQLPKGAQRRTSVRSLNPNMQFVQRWLKFMVLPLSYEVWAFPYRLALGYPTTDIRDSSTTLLADALCDAAFAVDMAISLVTAVPLPDSEEFVTSFGEISRLYFRNTFPFQVLVSACLIDHSGSSLTAVVDF